MVDFDRNISILQNELNSIDMYDANDSSILGSNDDED